MEIEDHLEEQDFLDLRVYLVGLDKTVSLDHLVNSVRPVAQVHKVNQALQGHLDRKLTGLLDLKDWPDQQVQLVNLEILVLKVNPVN